MGHSLTGLIIILSQHRVARRFWLFLLAVLFFAMAPDIDFLFGFLAGDMNLYHHQATHSLFFVIVVGLAGGLLWGVKWPDERWRAIASFIAAGSSHLLLDAFSIDTSVPFGMQILWPAWKGYWMSPVSIFSDVQRSAAGKDFFISLFNRHNWHTVRFEMIVLVPVTLLIFCWKMKRK